MNARLAECSECGAALLIVDVDTQICPRCGTPAPQREAMSVRDIREMVDEDERSWLW